MGVFDTEDEAAKKFNEAANFYSKPSRFDLHTSSALSDLSDSDSENLENSTKSFKIASHSKPSQVPPIRNENKGKSPRTRYVPRNELPLALRSGKMNSKSRISPPNFASTDVSKIVVESKTPSNVAETTLDTSEVRMKKIELGMN